MKNNVLVSIILVLMIMPIFIIADNVNSTTDSKVRLDSTLSSSSTSWDPEAIPVCTQNGSQGGIKVCSDGNGGAIIVWSDYRDDSRGDIYAQLIDDQEVCQWNANGVAVCTAYGYQLYFDICSDGNGGIIIVWEDEVAHDIYAQKIDAMGNVLWDVNGVMIGKNDTYQLKPKICSDNIGGAIITWYELNDTSSVYAQRIDAYGSLVWTPGGVEITATDNSYIIDPQICVDRFGGAIIVWDDWRNPSSDIYGQRINSNGITQWTPNGKLICSAGNSQKLIKMCKNPIVGALFAWVDWRDTTGPDIYAQRIDLDGDVLWSTNGVPVCSKNEWQTNIELCIDYQGGLIITWEDDREGGRRLFAQRIDAGGQVRWTQDGIRVCSANSKQVHQRVCTNGTNGIFITWADYRGRVYAQKLNTDGKIIGNSNGYLICNSDYLQTDPDICPSNNGTVIIAWEDTRGADRDIYAQRLNIEQYIPPEQNGIPLELIIIISSTIGGGVVIAIAIVLLTRRRRKLT